MLVIGHTDDQPLRSFRFKDNYELSRARALQVAGLLRKEIEDAARIEAAGKGSLEPRYQPAECRRIARATGASKSSIAGTADMLAILKSRAFLLFLGLAAACRCCCGSPARTSPSRTTSRSKAWSRASSPSSLSS